MKTAEIQDLLHTTLGSVRDGVITTDTTGTVTFLNPVARQLTGWEGDEAIGQPISSIVPAAGAGATRLEQATVSTKTGGTLLVDGSVAPIRANGRIVGSVLVFRDLTARNKAADAQFSLDAIVEFSEDAIVGRKLDGTITSWNDAATRIFGYSASEMIGGAAHRLILPGQPDDCSETLERIRQGECVRHHEARRRRKDGEEIVIELTASPIRDAAGRIVGASTIARDITERKRAELVAQAERKRIQEQLLRAQKLESLSVLAGGIAHDFNNLLMGIIANATLMMDDAPPGSPLADLGENILAATEQAAHLTRQMLAYSGRGQFAIERLNLSSQIEGIVSLMKSSIPKGVRLCLKLAPNLPCIEADAGQIQQVVMNLTLNAAEAIEGEGVVTISASSRRIGEPNYQGNLAGAFLAPGRYVVLEVKDTGSGMDEATQAKMFDPFFTTHLTGRGLGLSAVLGIVRGHRGGISVSSAPGAGASFEVFFPVNRERASEAQAG